MQLLLNVLLESFRDVAVFNALEAAALNRLTMLRHQFPNGVRRGRDKVHIFTEDEFPAHRKVQSAPVSGIGQFVDADVQRGGVTFLEKFAQQLDDHISTSHGL